MSVQDLLTPTPPAKPWANLYINDLTADEITANTMTIGTLTITNLDVTNITFLGGTADSVLYLNGVKQIQSQVLGNGQLQIGSNGNIPVVGSLTGTTNQINVTNGAGSITLSTPQNIATTSTPTFNSMNLSSQGRVIAYNDGASGQSVVIGASPIVCTFDHLNINGTDLSYNSGIFTAHVNGTYLVTYSVDFTPGITGIICGAQLGVTSAGPSSGIGGVCQLGVANTITSMYLTGSSIIVLNQNDTLTLNIYAKNTGTTFVANQEGEINIYRLS